MLDKNRRPLGISPDDSRNLLTDKARLRIDDAFQLQYSIRKTARARICARCDGEENWDADARAEWSAAKMDSAFAVLSVWCQELINIGKKGRALEAIMRLELDGAVGSLELSDDEKDAVWTRLYTVREGTAIAVIGAGNEVARERQRWMRGRHPGWGISQWADHTKITYKTMQKYWEGETTKQTNAHRAVIAENEGVPADAVPL
jgi:hypothetical protein